MKSIRITWLLFAFAATFASAQTIPTGTLTGTVTDGKVPLPGVTVTVTSPNLQGARIATSTINGDYILDLLPPGLYTVRFELEGFQAVEASIKVSAARSSWVDAVMQQVRAAENVTVTGALETISTTATAATTYDSTLIQTLPVERDAFAYVALTPGIVGDVPFPQIAGAISAESLYLVNGVVTGENVLGGFLPLYIEDAIQEVTTTVSDVSAEYGRFTGGVVNALTKSGGNELHGSFRANLTNPKWSSATPVTLERPDTVSKVWEATFGGYLLKDRLWFFAGGQAAPQTSSQQTYPPVSIPVRTTSDETRDEVKLTLSINPQHRAIASYMHRERTSDNVNMSGAPLYDLASFTSLAIPEELIAFNYAGVWSNSLVVEGQYSARKLTYGNSGSYFTDLERGTPVYDKKAGAFYNSALWCAVCPDAKEGRDNQDLVVKAMIFLSTKRAGSHDIRVGVDAFDDMNKVNTWQTGSGYLLDAASVNIVGTGTGARYFPVVLPGVSMIEYFPIFQMARGNHFKTYSAFANDVWRLNTRLTFSVGVRFDKNDGTDSSGTKVVRDSKWSPRLSVTWDPRGDGDVQVALGYGQYVAAIENGFGNAQAKGGVPAQYGLAYEGPPINATGNDLETHDALDQVFTWLHDIGGVLANRQLWTYAYVPGYQVVIGNDLRSPGTTEWTIGLITRLGTHALVRLDVLDRRWGDLYSDRVDRTTGTTMDPFGNQYDRILVENDSQVERKYQALFLQADVRPDERLRIGGSYTLARLVGNDVAKLFPSLNSLDAYPEYRDLRWYAPRGYLGGDHRHTLQVYASWDAVNKKVILLNLSVRQSYVSGAPYGASSTQVAVAPYVTNPGYVTPPDYAGQYFFRRPDAYRTDPVYSTDFAATLTFKVGRAIEIYVNPQIRNVFNRQAVVNPNTTVYVNDSNPDTLAPFNPFTETPKQCPQGATCNLADGYNWQKAPEFGKAVLPTDYQTPRMFLLNVGVRF